VRPQPFPVPRTLPVEAIERRRKEMLRQLAEGGDIARGVLPEMFPRSFQLEPDESGSYLWAAFVDDIDTCRVSLLYGSREERLNARAAATLAATQGGEPSPEGDDMGHSTRVRVELRCWPALGGPASKGGRRRRIAARQNPTGSSEPTYLPRPA
jgi:hypothetical protein